MGGIVAKQSYNLEEAKAIAGQKWTADHYVKFMAVAVLTEHVSHAGEIISEYRVNADFIKDEIEKLEDAAEILRWTVKKAHTEEAVSGSRVCVFTPEEIRASSDSSCSCADSDRIEAEFTSSALGHEIRIYLAKLARFANTGDGIDPSVILYAEDPVPGVTDICRSRSSLFLDVEYLVGPQMAGPCAGRHGSHSYNFETLKCFCRPSHLNPRPTCLFDTSSMPVCETLIQVDGLVGNSEIVAALGGISGLYDGAYVKSIISPSTELSAFGVYSVKVRLMVPSAENSETFEMVDAYILIDDFIPADETNCCVFAAAPYHSMPCAWSCLFEKAATKLLGQSRGGYRETAHKPELAGRLMSLLTGVSITNYDVTKPPQWRRLHRLMGKGKDCRVAAATVTKEDIRKHKSHGIIAGTGVHGYTILQTCEVPTKFKEPIKLLRIRNTCKAALSCIFASSHYDSWRAGGKQEWTGAWSDTSKEYKAHVSYLGTPAEDGCFWMTCTDFVQFFQGVFALVIPSNWNRHTPHTVKLHRDAEGNNSHMFLEEPSASTGEPDEDEEGGASFLTADDQKTVSLSQQGDISQSGQSLGGAAQATADSFNRNRSSSFLESVVPPSQNPFNNNSTTGRSKKWTADDRRNSFHAEDVSSLIPNASVGAPIDMAQYRESLRQSFSSGNNVLARLKSKKDEEQAQAVNPLIAAAINLPNGSVGDSLAKMKDPVPGSSAGAKRVLPRVRRSTFTY
jgi:hypothetical protein